MSFSSFITPQIAEVLYVLGLIGGVLNALRVISFGLGFGDLVSAVSLVVTTLLWLLIYAIFLRVILEGFIAVVRTAENTRILAEDVLNRSANGNESN